MDRTDPDGDMLEALAKCAWLALAAVHAAPAAVLFNAVSHAAAALLLASIRVDEPAPPRQPDRRLWRELREGASWVYRHRVLAHAAGAPHDAVGVGLHPIPTAVRLDARGEVVRPEGQHSPFRPVLACTCSLTLDLVAGLVLGFLRDGYRVCGQYKQQGYEGGEQSCPSI